MAFGCQLEKLESYFAEPKEYTPKDGREKALHTSDTGVKVSHGTGIKMNYWDRPSERKKHCKNENDCLEEG